MLTSTYKTILNRWVAPLASLIARSGISPSAITLACPLLTSLVCLMFWRTRAVLPFCVASLAVGLLDGLDGAVARAGGRVTKFGAYLDAMADRYVELLIALTVAAVSGYWLLITLVITGSLLVSYAKARAAMEVSIVNLEWPDLMERTERGLLFLGGLALSVLVPWRPLGRDLFWWMLVGLAILIHAAVIQRILRARRLIRERQAN